MRAVAWRVLVAVAVLALTLAGPGRTLAQRPSGVDLDVTYIEMVRPDGTRWTIDDSNGGWPQQSEPVLFRGHVLNQGEQAAGPFTVTWSIDGSLVQRAPAAGLAAASALTPTLQWTWPMTTTADGRIVERHTLRLAVAFDDAQSEVSLANNAVEDTIGGLAVGFWVEQSVYDFYNQNQFANCAGQPCQGSNSFEDWAQRNLRHWNEMLANVTPTLLDRVRLDKLVVVPDRTLPLTALPDGKPSNTPDASDRTVDMMWGFDVQQLSDSYWQSTIQDWDPGLIHELAHARGLPDMYALNVQRGRDRIDVTDDEGRPAWDYFPAGDLVYTARYEDLMSGLGLHFFGPYSAGAFKQLEGQRNWGINYNPPYDDDFHSPPLSWRIVLVTSNLPAHNRVRVLGQDGRPLVGAQVKLYPMDSARNGVWYAKVYRNVPSVVGTTDRAGMLDIGHNPFGPTFFCPSVYCAQDCVAEDNWMPLLAVRYAGRTEFHFLEHTDVNLAYWRGERDVATYDIATGLEPERIYLPVVVSPHG